MKSKVIKYHSIIKPSFVVNLILIASISFPYDIVIYECYAAGNGIEAAFGIQLGMPYITNEYSDACGSPTLPGIDCNIRTYCNIKPPIPNSNFIHYSFSTCDGKVYEIDALSKKLSPGDKNLLCNDLISLFSQKYGVYENRRGGTYTWEGRIDHNSKERLSQLVTLYGCSDGTQTVSLVYKWFVSRAR